MKKNFTLLLLIMFLISCGKTNKEKIIGTWEISSFDFYDKSVASEDEISQLNEANRTKAGFWDGWTRFVFNKNRRIQVYRGPIEAHKDAILEYRIINEDMHSYYPNYPNEIPNGSLISIVGYEDDGRLYGGTNIFGPFEIVKLSKNELVLRNVYPKFHWGGEYKTIKENNLLINLTRVSD